MITDRREKKRGEERIDRREKKRGREERITDIKVKKR